MKVVPINSIPALRFVPGLRSRYLELCNTHDRMMKFLNDALNNSLREVDENDAEVSFASTYRDAEGAKYDRTELLYILRDLIVAGTETSMTSLRWALIELANRPELQVSLHESVVVIGRVAWRREYILQAWQMWLKNVRNQVTHADKLQVTLFIAYGLLLEKY